jgi:hypothetical protein
MVSTVSTFNMSGEYLHSLRLKSFILYFLFLCDKLTQEVDTWNNSTTVFSSKYSVCLNETCVFHSGNACCC